MLSSVSVFSLLTFHKVKDTVSFSINVGIFSLQHLFAKLTSKCLVGNPSDRLMLKILFKNVQLRNTLTGHTWELYHQQRFKFSGRTEGFTFYQIKKHSISRESGPEARVTTCSFILVIDFNMWFSAGIFFYQDFKLCIVVKLKGEKKMFT